MAGMCHNQNRQTVIKSSSIARISHRKTQKSEQYEEEEDWCSLDRCGVDFDAPGKNGRLPLETTTPSQR
jgi:hypothetical protein